MTDPGERERFHKPGFNEILLGALMLLVVALAGMVIGFYLLPGEHLETPELLPGVRVTREGNLPVGASRLVSWGDQIILVVRNADNQYAALQGVSPKDGCILEWDLESQRVVSPCNYVVFDLQGNVVSGLTDIPLRRWPVFVRSGVVYVGREL